MNEDKELYKYLNRRLKRNRMIGDWVLEQVDALDSLLHALYIEDWVFRSWLFQKRKYFGW